MGRVSNLHWIRFLNGRINRIKLHFASLVLDKRQNRLCGFSSSRLEATNQAQLDS
jgi:hypothetical protein